MVEWKSKHYPFSVIAREKRPKQSLQIIGLLRPAEAGLAMTYMDDIFQIQTSHTFSLTEDK